jgi:tetratricopeptide (TPR) repeat protein
MKKWLLASALTLVTLFLALGIVRWMAPQLLGIPVDLQMVQVSKEVPPFFDGVFRDEDYNSSSFIIPDPYLKRAKPLYPETMTAGPHDILGFRNRVIPNSATIIVIGDSQTYGNNVILEKNWPSQLRMRLDEAKSALYTMTVGGWAAVEYLEVFPKALRLKPRMVVVAFYTGNDPLESFRLAYAGERWKSLRPDTALTEQDMPEVAFPPPESEWWTAEFADGTSTTFTPRLRLGSNNDHPAVGAGYAVMAEVARRMGTMADENNTNLVFTIIPTKELVYEKKVKLDRLQPPADYSALVQAERRNLEELARQLQAVPGALYVDVLDSLQEAALTTSGMYPNNLNGHPLSHGYAVIAEALAGEIDNALSPMDPDADKASLRFRNAFALQQAGHHDEAILYYEETLALDPTHTQAAFNLSYALLARAPRDLRQASTLLQQVTEQRPGYTEAMYRLGEAHRLMGEKAEAARWYRRFLSAGGHQDLVKQARQRLSALEAP